MFQRLFPFALLAAVLGALIVYSKYRPTPDRVSGYVEADEIRVGSRVGGRVEEVLVSEGEVVEQGQPLIRLEPYDLLELKREAEATLAARTAEHARLQAGYRPEEIGQSKAQYEQLQARLDKLVAGPRRQEIEAARARLAVAEAQQGLAQKVVDRAESLAGTSAISREEMDRAVQTLAAAQGDLTARREELSLLEAGTREEEIREVAAMVEQARLAWEASVKGYRQEEIAQAASARDAAAAALAALEDRIDELVIRSPTAGVVEALDLQPGDLAGAGAPVLSLMNVESLWVRGYLPENRLDVQVGQQVEVTVDSFPDQRFRAHIAFLSRQAEFTPSNVQTPEERVKQVFRFKATLAKESAPLRPGMSADVWLSTPTTGR